MNITVTGRHTSVSDRLRDYTEKKVVRLERYFNQVFEFKAIYYPEKMDKVCELLVFADGVQFHGMEKAGDFYSAFDLLLDKLEQQVKKFKEKHQLHKGTHLGEVPVVDITSEEDDRMLIGIHHASGKPSDEVEAYLQMKAEGDYFRVYRTSGKDAAATAVLFANGSGFHLAEASAEGAIAESDIMIAKDSWTNPEMNRKPAASGLVKKLSLKEALGELVASERWFLPFFNADTAHLNVLYQRGKRVELMVLDEK